METLFAELKRDVGWRPEHGEVLIGDDNIQVARISRRPSRTQISVTPWWPVLIVDKPFATPSLMELVETLCSKHEGHA